MSILADHATYSDIVRLVGQMSEDGTPLIVGRQAFNVSGSLVKRAFPVFGDLHMTTAAGQPTETLKRLVAGYGKPGFKAAMWELVSERYTAFGIVDLEHATVSSMLETAREHFQRYEPGSVIRFYVVAAIKAGMSVSLELRKAAGRIQQDDYDTARGDASRAARRLRGDADETKAAMIEESSGTPSPRPREAWNALRCAEMIHRLYDADGMPMGSPVAKLFFGLIAELNRIGEQPS